MRCVYNELTLSAHIIKAQRGRSLIFACLICLALREAEDDANKLNMPSRVVMCSSHRIKVHSVVPSHKNEHLYKDNASLTTLSSNYWLIFYFDDVDGLKSWSNYCHFADTKLMIEILIIEINSN